MTAEEIRLARRDVRQAWLLLRLDGPPHLAPLIEALEQSHLGLLETMAKGIEALDTFGIQFARSAKGSHLAAVPDVDGAA